MNVEELCEQYDYLVTITLQKMFQNPHKYARSINIEYDDLLQFGRLGVWEAVKKYEEKKIGTLRNFIIRNIKWSIGRHITQEQAKGMYYKQMHNKKYTDRNHKVPVISMSNKPYKEDETDYYDLIACDNIFKFKNDDSIEKKVFSKEEFNDMFKYLKEKQRKIILMRMNGYTYKEIGDHLGVTRQAIENKLKTIKKKLS